MPGIIKSFGFAFKGLKFAWQEKHVRVHVVIALLVSAAGFGFGISRMEWLILLLLFALVISLEIINTAIEHLVNLAQPNWHEQAGKIKDLSAGAVLCASIFAAICGILIFGKYILDLLKLIFNHP